MPMILGKTNVGLFVRVRAGLAIASGVALLSLTPSCLVDDPPAYPEPHGVFVGGECMCATCWDRAFCWDRENGVSADVNSDGSCADGLTLAEKVTRIDASLNDRDSATLFCVPDQAAVDLEKLINPSEATATRCPDGDADREKLGYVDMCQDIPVDCRDAECLEHGDSSLCSFASADRIGDYRTACGNDSTAAAHKLREQSCAAHGFDVPAGDAPARYCYLNCWEPINQYFSTCEPSLFDPPGIGSDTVIADLDPESSQAFMTITSSGGNGEGRLKVSGTVGLRFSKNCIPPSTDEGDAACDQATLTMLDIQSIDFTSLLGRKVENVVVENPTPLPLSAQSTVLGTRLAFNLDGGAQLYVTADVQDLGRKGVAYDTVGAIGGTIRWSARELSLNANLSNGIDPRTALQLVLTGTIRNRLPVANAGADQTLECGSPGGATVHLDATKSGDPDGSGDLKSFLWDFTGPAGAIELSGQEVDVTVPPGESAFQLTVGDRAGATSVDLVKVTVVDTKGPDIELSEQGSFATCDSADVQLKTPVATDACSDDVTVEGEVVAIDGVPVTPIPVVDGKVTASPGTITVRWTAADANGNVSTLEQLVDVGRSLALVAAQGMKIGPESSIVTTDGQPGGIANAGDQQLLLASNVHSGTVSSVGSVTAAARVLIDGDVTTSGRFHAASGVRVTGSIMEHTDPLLPPLPEVTVAFPRPTGGDVLLHAGSSRSLAPGSYGRVLATNRSALTLQAGTYYFRELRLAPGATLHLANEATLFIEQDFDWSGTLDQPDGGSLTIELAACDTAVVNAPLSALLIAPHTHVIVNDDFTGQIFARVIDVGPRVDITCHD